jgi:hypothetical protein
VRVRLGGRQGGHGQAGGNLGSRGWNQG